MSDKFRSDYSIWRGMLQILLKSKMWINLKMKLLKELVSIQKLTVLTPPAPSLISLLVVTHQVITLINGLKFLMLTLLLSLKKMVSSIKRQLNHLEIISSRKETQSTQWSSLRSLEVENRIQKLCLKEMA